jgi:hypothetical protein
MYVKKNLILWAAVFALALPLMFAGAASAKYMQDGAVQDATSGGWDTPSDGVCVLSIDASGNMVTDVSITNKRDCDARLVSVTAVTTGDTLANVCGNTTKNTAGVKYAAPGSSTCVTIDGSGYITGSKSMANLDRNATICNALGGQLANAVPTTLANGAVISTATQTTANGTAATCIAYGWQFRGQDATGSPLTFGGQGVAQGAGTGYCYTSMDLTQLYTASTCPAKDSTSSSDATYNGLTAVTPNTGFNSSTAYDWAWTGTKCTYAKGIAGKLTNKLTKVNGSTYAAGSFLDMSTFTTQGACLANGGSWANWIGQAPSTISLATTTPTIIPNWGNYSVKAADADDGCLHCHSTTVQYNGPSERWKNSYVKTGHKNMLRAVTGGKPWAGPDGVIYATDGANTINFTTTSNGYSQIVVGGVNQNLYYIYGDWMAALPTTLYSKTTASFAGWGSSPTGTTADNNGYSCYPCHATGSSDSSTVVLGLQGKGVPGVQSIGTPGYAGIEPGNTFPNLLVNANNPKWDLNGIQCSRCHNAVVAPMNSTQIAASNYPTTAPTSGGMGALASGTGRNNLCFGCHQSIDKVWPAGTAKTADPTSIPTGVSHGAQYGRDFNGHVLGNSFLNSVHAEYTGTMSLNSLGNMDLSDPNGTTEYGSIFKGYTCWQSPTSNSPGKTKADGTEIKTKSDCETLYGAGSWRADGSGDLGTTQGTCTTCHDVHNSLFVDSQKEAAMRKTCQDCHVNNATTGATDAAAPQVVVSSINHPTVAGTPFDTTKYDNPCVVCHMATQAEKNGDQTSMPVHVWRINTSASYNTFPTMAQWYGGSCSVHTGAIKNAPTLPVVYNSDTSSANCTAALGTWTPATQTKSAQAAADGTYANAVWVDLDLACGQCHGGSFGAGNTHNGAMYLDKATLAGYAAVMHSTGGIVSGGTNTPVVSHTAPVVTGWSVSFTDTSTCADGAPNIIVNWGDGSPSATGAQGSTFTHAYATTRVRSYTISQVAQDPANSRLSAITRFAVNVPQRYTVSGIVTTSTGTPIPNGYVYLKDQVTGHIAKYMRTLSNGTFNFTGVLPDVNGYKVHVYKFGVTFGADVLISNAQLSTNPTVTITATNP